MSKGRGNDILGVGGQRCTLSKSDLRGGGFGSTRGTADPMAARRELVRRLRAESGRNN